LYNCLLVEQPIELNKILWKALVFLLKVKGDYHRYHAEILVNEEKQNEIDKAYSSYEQATEIANKKLLPPTDVIRLELALNFSVFYYEIMENIDKACKISKCALDGAILDIDTISRTNCVEINPILELLAKNNTEWKEKNDGGGEEEEKGG